MRIYDIQSAFARGELSPRLHARTDIDHYRMGLKECTNWYVLRQGALRKRPGTQFMAETKVSSKKARLIPFTFSTEQSYVLEFGELYMRIYAKGGRIEDGGPVEVVTPYSEADLFDLKYAQSADTLYIAHPDHAPRKVTRTSDTAWTIEEIEFFDGPYLPEPELGVSDVNLSFDKTGNPVPKMTGNTSTSDPVPAGTVVFSSQNQSAHLAFDQSNTTGWTANSIPAWVGYEKDGAVDYVVNGYFMTGISTTPTNQFSGWTFDGFDGVNWITLDQREGEVGWTFGEKRYYEFKNKTGYRQYRVNILENEAGTIAAVMGIRFKEDPDTVGGASEGVTCTASGTQGINDGAGFQPMDIGRMIRFRGSDSIWRWFRITAHNSPTEVVGKLYGAPLLDKNPMSVWRLGAWCEACGYPASVTFFEERLVWARTKTEPQKIWGSKTFAFEDHGISSPLVDDDAFTIEIASDQVNEIKWISEATELLIGTSAAIRTLGPSDTSKAFSATNVQQRRHTTVGSAGLQPVQIGGVVLYADSYAKSLRELFFSFENNAFTAPELTILSDHLLASGIAGLSYAEAPDSIVWIAVGTGELVSLTFERDQRIVGMARHTVAGGAADEHGIVESVATIPGEKRSEVWLIIRRIIGGATRRYVERLSEFAEGGAVEDAAFLDSHLTYSGAPAATFAGLGHLEGETVTVFADGTVEPDQVVSGGAVSLPEGRVASKVAIGLPYESKLQQLPPPLDGQDGSLLGRLKSVPEVFVDVYESLGLRAGAPGQEIELMERHDGEPFDQQITPRTGSYKLHGLSGWRDEARVSVLSDKPLPATIRAITRAVEMEP